MSQSRNGWPTGVCPVRALLSDLVFVYTGQDTSSSPFPSLPRENQGQDLDENYCDN